MDRFTVYREHTTEYHTDQHKNAPDEPQFEGVVFEDGSCVLRWLTPLPATSVWDSFAAAMGVHGHPEYGSKVVFHDAVLPLPWEDKTDE